MYGKLVKVIGAFALVAVGTSAMAGGTPLQKCIGSKLKAAGKAVSSELGCDSKGKAKSLPTDPNCIVKAQTKLNSAIVKAGVLCAGTSASINAQVTLCRTNMLPDAPNNGKCPSSSIKAIGKGAGSELSCQSKEVTKPGSFAGCDAKEDGKTAGAITKAGVCGQATFAVINGHIDSCNTAISNDINPPPTTTTTSSSTSTSTTSTSTSTSSSTVTTTSSTTSTTIATCNCCDKTQLSFTTTSAFGAITGNLKDNTGNDIINLVAGSLYFGGGQDGVPLPAKVPGQGQSLTAITSCNSVSGALTFGPRTAAQTGSVRNCTDVGCFFGPPLPIPNPGNTPISTCVVNVVSTAASGSGNCTNGSVASLNLPLASGIYLSGDNYGPAINGIQPCPICTSGTCKGGTNNGLACVPSTDTPGVDEPTSFDCPPDPNHYIGALPIGFNLTTGTQTKTAADLPAMINVFCGFCASAGGTFEGSPTGPAHACTSAANCTTGIFTKCRQKDPGAFATDANLLPTARTITVTGSPAGVCLDDGAAHATELVSIFCIPPTYNAAVDGSASLPGPGATALPGVAKLLP